MYRLGRVFRNNPDPEDAQFFAELDHAFERLEGFGYTFELEEAEHLFTDYQQLVWEEVEERATCTVVKEPDDGICYLIVTASRRSHGKDVLRSLADQLDFERLEDLQEQARRHLLWHPEHLVKVAIAAEKPDHVSLDLLRDGLQHLSPRGRLEAVTAIAHCRWPELITDLETLLRVEPDVQVQRLARKTLDVLQA